MFRHDGNTRNLNHNLKIASLLCFVAGIVNVAGFLAVKRLTTNVTGHFAFFVDELFKFHLWDGFIYFLYILFFFTGSLTSNLLIEFITRRHNRFRYAAPILLECIILFSIGLVEHGFVERFPNVIAFCLLYSMGLQNSLVTTISNARVRTTHLTGLFTDLGIDVSQLFFFKKEGQKQQLRSSIKLRLTIISSFFIGGLFSGLAYSKIGLRVLIIATLLLLFGLVYDSFKFRFILIKRKRIYSKRPQTSTRIFFYNIEHR